MYTGIIQALCEVISIEDKQGLRSFKVRLPKELMEGLQTGASIAVDGTCFTVVSFLEDIVVFDAMKETLEKTTIGLLKENDRVNIERSAKMGDEIGGHVMSGHVSTKAKIIHVEESENNKVDTFQVDPEWMKYIFSKGFVGLDGASLTVVDADQEKGTFKVWFIPETLERTRFGLKEVGDEVNVEIDTWTQLVVDTTEKYLNSQKK